MKFSRYLYIFSALFLNIMSVDGYAEEKDRGKGVLTADELTYAKLASSLTVSNEWSHVSNDESITCKFYAHRIAISDLMEELHFKNEDIIQITELNRNDYDQTSVYWRSCNRVWYFGEEKIDKQLSWFDATYVVEGKLALVLIKELDKPKGEVRAVVINKENQILANRREDESLWDVVKNIYHSMVYGHPEVKQYELTGEEKKVLGENVEKE